MGSAAGTLVDSNDGKQTISLLVLQLLTLDLRANVPLLVAFENSRRTSHSSQRGRHLSSESLVTC